MPFLRYDNKVIVQSFVGLGEALDQPNPIISRLHVVGFALQILEIIAPIYVMMG